jgi:hypothetical protein
VGGLSLFGAGMTVLTYQMRHVTYEDNNYAGLVFPAFFGFALFNALIVSFPLALIVEWWQKSGSKKSQAFPFVGACLAFVLSVAFNNVLITTFFYIAYASINFAVYWFLFVSMRNYLFKRKSINA